VGRAVMDGALAAFSARLAREVSPREPIPTMATASATPVMTMAVIPTAFRAVGDACQTNPMRLSSTLNMEGSPRIRKFAEG